MKKIFLLSFMFLTACAEDKNEFYNEYYSLIDTLKIDFQDAHASMPQPVIDFYPNITDYRSLCYMTTSETTLVYQVNNQIMNVYRSNCYRLLEIEEDSIVKPPPYWP